MFRLKKESSGENKNHDVFKGGLGAEGPPPHHLRMKEPATVSQKTD